MHYHLEMFIEGKTACEVCKKIESILEPYCEHEHEDGFWDWFMIGGRWRGIHAPGHDPYKDESLIETCNLCNGTGVRKDMVVANGCNGCMGKGKRTKWPTQWKQHESDVIKANKIDKSLSCHALYANGKFYFVEEWDGENIKKTDFSGNVIEKLQSLGVDLSKGYLITVDYHC